MTIGSSDKSYNQESDLALSAEKWDGYVGFVSELFPNPWPTITLAHETLLCSDPT